MKKQLFILYIFAVAAACGGAFVTTGAFAADAILIESSQGLEAQYAAEKSKNEKLIKEVADLTDKLKAKAGSEHQALISEAEQALSEQEPADVLAAAPTAGECDGGAMWKPLYNASHKNMGFRPMDGNSYGRPFEYLGNQLHQNEDGGTDTAKLENFKTACSKAGGKYSADIKEMKAMKNVCGTYNKYYAHVCNMSGVMNGTRNDKKCEQLGRLASEYANNITQYGCSTELTADGTCSGNYIGCELL